MIVSIISGKGGGLLIISSYFMSERLHKSERIELLMCFYLDMCFIYLHYYTCEIKEKGSVNMFFLLDEQHHY